MSLEPMLWALYKAPVVDRECLLILVALAEHAHPDGTASFPSQQAIADTALMSLATTKRHMADLEETGLIVRGDQQLVAHYPGNRRPVVWNLSLDKVSPRVGRASKVPAHRELPAHGELPERPQVAHREPSGRPQVAHREPSGRGSGSSNRGVQVAQIGDSGSSPVSYKPSTKPKPEPTPQLPPTRAERERSVSNARATPTINSGGRVAPRYVRPAPEPATRPPAWRAQFEEAKSIRARAAAELAEVQAEKAAENAVRLKHARAELARLRQNAADSADPYVAMAAMAGTP